MTEVPDYRARKFKFLDVWRAGEISLKAYLIECRPPQMDAAALVKRAQSYATSRLPEVADEEGANHGLGYAILHVGEMSNWLLLHWWAHGDIAMRMLASCDRDGNEFTSQDHRRFHACVWEHVVIDHERDAWVRQMMCADGLAKNYLDDRLANGLY